MNATTKAVSTAPAPRQNIDNAVVTFDVRGDEVKLSATQVRNYLTRGDETVTDQEVVMFINLCKFQKLNPFLNEAYLIKFKGSPAQIITSKEAYMRKADACPDYDGMRAGIITERGGEVVDIEGAVLPTGHTLVGGWCEVYRKDRKYPTKVRVSLAEYDKKRSTWNAMRNTMIRKVAIVHALREAFPTDLNGMYTEEEKSTTREIVGNEIKAYANAEKFDAPPPPVPPSVHIDEAEVVASEPPQNDAPDMGF